MFMNICSSSYFLAWFQSNAIPLSTSFSSMVCATLSEQRGVLGAEAQNLSSFGRESIGAFWHLCNVYFIDDTQAEHMGSEQIS